MMIIQKMKKLLSLLLKKYIESLDEEEFIKEEDDESIVNTNTIHIGGI